MADHDDSLIDKVKHALGMGDDERRTDRPREMEQPVDDASPHRTEGFGGISGAAEASGRQGTAGGIGTTGAVGSAGAGGPVGATDPTGEATDPAGTGTADPGAVKTEYEMGHDVDPDHEDVAESGFSGGPETSGGPKESTDPNRQA